MAHGVWMDRASLDSALAELARIYAEPDPASVGAAQAIAAAHALQAEVHRGFAFDSKRLAEAAAKARALGLGEAAARFDALAAIPTDPPCAAWTPG
jgi:hypothetical protein